MRVLVVGLESSGTKLLTRLLAPVCDSVHRSVPYGDDWWADPGPVEAAVVIVRSWAPTAASQQARGHVEKWTGLTVADKLRHSLPLLVYEVDRLDVPWTLVTYEELTANPARALTGVCQALGLPVPEPGEAVYNGNGDTPDRRS